MLQYSVAQQSAEPGSTPLCNQPALGQLSPGGFSYKVFRLLRQSASQQIIPLQIIPWGSLCSSFFSPTLKRGCFAATMKQCMHLLQPGFSNVPQAVIPSSPQHHRAHRSQPPTCSPASSETLSDRAGLSAPAVTAPGRAGSQLSAGLGWVWMAGSTAPRKWKGQSCQQHRHWSWDLV